jgi:hypothetical protein
VKILSQRKERVISNESASKMRIENAPSERNNKNKS